jgi:formamidopyrimidine-DNA glycosylase
VLHLSEGLALYVNDQRRFAWLRLLPASQADQFVAEQRYGPDPLAASFDVDQLAERLRARNGRAIKASLLDQTCIAGIGNIYADEALHRAGIHPARRTGDLSRHAVERLHAAIAAVLARAVPVGGAIVKGSRAVDDPMTGRDFLRVHGRAGDACPACEERGLDGPPATIVRGVVAGRGTYFCPNCQPPPVSAP